MQINTRFCIVKGCDAKLMKRPRGHNIFGEVTYDMECPRCKKIIIPWESICEMKDIQNDRVAVEGAL